VIIVVAVRRDSFTEDRRDYFGKTSAESFQQNLHAATILHFERLSESANRTTKRFCTLLENLDVVTILHLERLSESALHPITRFRTSVEKPDLFDITRLRR
jgi:hypothetical protein